MTRLRWSFRWENTGSYATTRPPDAFPYGSADLLRIRVSRYRILYEIDQAAQAITVLHVGRVA